MVPTAAFVDLTASSIDNPIDLETGGVIPNRQLPSPLRMAVIQTEHSPAYVQRHLRFIQSKSLFRNRMYIAKRDEVIDFIPPN